jgi:hypothetical protein
MKNIDEGISIEFFAGPADGFTLLWLHDGDPPETFGVIVSGGILIPIPSDKLDNPKGENYVLETRSNKYVHEGKVGLSNLLACTG